MLNTTEHSAQLAKAGLSAPVPNLPAFYAQMTLACLKPAT